MKHVVKFKVRRVVQESRDGRVMDHVRLERADESDAPEVSVSVRAASPSGFKPEQSVLVTVEVVG